MPLSPRHWRARHLLGAWIAYWAALLAVTLGPAALALWRIRDAPENTSNASFSFGDQGLVGRVTAHGTTVWSGAASGVSVILALVGPPLLLWLLWLALRPPAGRPAAPRGIRGAATRPALPDAPLDDRLQREREATRERG